jgi:hypothetical protein
MMVVFLMMGLVFPVLAQDGYFPEDVREIALENSRLKERVEALESALLDIQGKLSAKPAAPAADAAKPKEKPAVRSKYNLELYGYIKADASRDDSEVTNTGTISGSFVRWVNRENLVDNDSHFNMTANETRFGVNLVGPADDKTKVTGNLEYDMFGTDRPENRSNLALRHAFLKVDWLKSEWSLTAGQTWDLIGMGVPTTLNYSAAWWAGNIGYRRPQVRLSKGFTYDKEHKLMLEAGAFRTIGNAGPFTSSDSGDDSTSPTFQGRIAYTFPGLNKKATTIAIAGLSGKEEVDIAGNGGEFNVKSRATSFNLDLPIIDKVTFKGEFWTGENIDTYLGGIGQGVVMTNATGTKAIDGAGLPNTFKITNVQTIKSTGRWLNLLFGPFGKWNYGVGYSQDNPENDVLPNLARADNSSRWLNAIYQLNEAVSMGIEFSRWDTGYMNAAKATNNRIQTSFIYRF